MYAHEIIVCMICTACNNQIPGLEDTVAASFRIFVPRQGLESSLKFRGEGVSPMSFGEHSSPITCHASRCEQYLMVTMSPSCARDLSIPGLFHVLTEKFYDEYVRMRGMLSLPVGFAASLEPEVSGSCRGDQV